MFDYPNLTEYSIKNISFFLSYRATLRFPRSIEALKNLSNTLQHYRDDHLAYLLLLYGSTYLYKQSFSLPGSAILVGVFIFVFNEYLLFLLNRIYLAVLSLVHGWAFHFVVY